VTACDFGLVTYKIDNFLQSFVVDCGPAPVVTTDGSNSGSSPVSAAVAVFIMALVAAMTP
jgi:hypothetical protein